MAAIGLVISQSSGSQAIDDGTQLAAAERSASERASRGGARSDEGKLAASIASATERNEFGAPSDMPDATTTTVAAETTTTLLAKTSASAQSPSAPSQPKAPAQSPTPAATAAPKAPSERSSQINKQLSAARGETTTTTTTTTAPPRNVDTGVVGNDVWSRLAMCESGGRNYSAGPYYGYFQFLPSTWRSLGGAGMPHQHTYLEQKDMAIKLQARSGWGQWPVCSKRIGAA